MSYLYIGIRDQGVRDLIDQLSYDQPRMDRYVEIRNNYDVINKC